MLFLLVRLQYKGKKEKKKKLNKEKEKLNCTSSGACPYFNYYPHAPDHKA
jgi:hypothetical protein